MVIGDQINTQMMLNIVSSILIYVEEDGLLEINYVSLDILEGYVRSAINIILEEKDIIIKTNIIYSVNNVKILLIKFYCLL